MGTERKIRFLTGVLFGREVWLNEGYLTLGERECDVIVPLTTNDIIELEEREQQLFVTAGKNKIRLNGHQHHSSRPLPEHGVLQIAGIVFAFGPATESLASYSLPQRGVWIMVAIFAVILIIIVALIAVNITTPTHSPSFQQHVEALLRQEQLTQVQAIWTPDGYLNLTGYCQSVEQMRRIRQQLILQNIIFRNNVICMDQLESAITDILYQAGFDKPQVIATAPGNVLIRANIVMDKRWQQVQTALTQLPGLQHWHIDNSYQTFGKQILTALVDNHLADRINVTGLDSGNVLISGLLTEEEKSRLNMITTTLQAQYPSITLNIIDALPSVAEAQKHLPDTIVGYVQGKLGAYLVLQNGVRIKKGTVLPDGSQIIALSEKAIGIHYKDALFSYPYSM